jgi:hypothetical protein
MLRADAFKATRRSSMALDDEREEEESMTGAEAFIRLIALLAVWGAGSVVLYFLSLLSVSAVVINVMLGVMAVCLVGALAMLFMERHSGAFLFASGPLITVGTILAVSAVLGMGSKLLW